MQVLKKDWLPQGPARAMILRLMSIPPLLGDLLATSIYPYLCVKLGWQAFPYIHGIWTAGFLGLWMLFVKDKPPSDLQAASATPQAAADQTAAAIAAPAAQTGAVVDTPKKT